MSTKAWILPMMLLFSAKTSYSQNFATKALSLQKVFDDIVNAYGNAKAPPSLRLIRKNDSEGYPASYISTPVPTVKVEETVFDICMKMGKDSLNALAIILSHELAHYYNDHTWCNDYSYAIRNTALGQEIKKQSRENQLTYEVQADNSSFYYSCIAGYTPFGVYDKLIDKIYIAYDLPTAVKGYPGKEERKMIARRALEKIRQLYPVYDAGLLLLYLNQLPAAESCFDYLAKYFPSREVYNNLGIAKFLAAMALKSYDTVNFIYPVDIDPASRIFQNSTRSADNENARFMGMLKDAKKQFEKAIGLDPSYISSHINLACVNDALGNYSMALGNIFEAEQLATHDIPRLKHIKAIVQYHHGNDDTAETLLHSLSIQDSLAAYNYRLLLLAKNTKNDIIVLENFKDNYAASLLNRTSTLKDCNTNPVIGGKGKKSQTKINTDLEITSVVADNYSNMSIIVSNKIIEATVTRKPDNKDVINSNGFMTIDPVHGCLVFAGSVVKKISYKVN